MRNPSFNWEKLRDVFYRSRELCNLTWPAQHDVRYALSTTVIAIELEEALQVYNYKGELKASLDRKQFQRILKFEFDEDEKLIIISPDSIKTIENWSPLEFKSVSLQDSIQDSIWDYQNGLIILQQSQDVYRHHNDAIELVCKNDGQYTLLTKEHWNCNREKAILLDVNHVFELRIKDKTLIKSIPDSQWHRVTLSPRDFICLYNAKFNKLQVYKNPERILLEHSLDESPKHIKWCGNDTVACSFLDEVKLYGPDNSYITFWFPNEITSLQTEIDGLKVFTDESIHFISRVTDYTSNIFRVGSTKAGAILLDSLDLLEDHASSAIENLKVINLHEAVEDCIKAAQDEFDPQLQKKLLSAASFGKASIAYKSFDSDRFVRACDVIRLLNLIRALDMFLTVQEYEAITLDGLIERLLVRHEHYKCILICNLVGEVMQLPKIFSHWAISKISLSPELDDDDLLAVLKKRYAEVPKYTQPHMAKVAHAAFLEGRFHLARDLSLLECSPELKISELLGLDDDNLALTECLKVQCPELTISLLLKLREKLTTTQLAKLLILDMPDEQLYPYFQRDNHEFLYDYFRQIDSFVDLALLLLVQGKKHGTIRTFLPQVQELYSKILNDSLVKQDTELLQRQENLWIYQETLSSKYDHNFVELTLDKTLGKLIEMKQERQVQDLLKKFKVSEKKYYHVKCKSLIEIKSFDELYQFATARKSPIGYMPFFSYLKRKNYNKEAIPYVSMVSSITYEEKKQMYLQCKGYHEAIQLAGKEKDIIGLKELYKMIPANEPRLKAQINEIMGNL